MGMGIWAGKFAGHLGGRSDKELPPVFTAPTGEVEYNPPPATIPEQRSESSTVHPNIAGVPTTVALRRSTRVRKAPDRLMDRNVISLLVLC
ncbi:hypothetical protein AVEN_216849-1 [Araneus ventricosus]|uniref:Uncharacterized protein n=1 Tax=Araneus ventricosus TaxID=182803 RepID=A0A4Y2THM0_ARAVE|nr:hypothetical protein AVEN_216849-1 [Araneus ventricosus]